MIFLGVASIAIIISIILIVSNITGMASSDPKQCKDYFMKKKAPGLRKAGLTSTQINQQCDNECGEILKPEIGRYTACTNKLTDKDICLLAKPRACQECNPAKNKWEQVKKGMACGKSETDGKIHYGLYTCDFLESSCKTGYNANYEEVIKTYKIKKAYYDLGKECAITDSNTYEKTCYETKMLPIDVPYMVNKAQAEQNMLGKAADAWNKLPVKPDMMGIANGQYGVEFKAGKYNGKISYTDDGGVYFDIGWDY